MMDPDNRKPDPNRWSTNKRVKAKEGLSVGAPLIRAAGAKMVRPGDANTTSAKFEKANERLTATERAQREADKAFWAERDKQESFLSEQRGKLLKRGWMTQREKEVMTILQGKSNKT